MEFIPSNPFLKFHPNTLEDIRKCWNLDRGRVVQSLAILKDWILKQNHLVNKNFSDHYLEFGLVACKGSMEKAKVQIDKLCAMKTLLPKFFFDGDVMKELADIVKLIWMLPMPKLTHDHCRVFVIKFKPNSLFTSWTFMTAQLALVMCEYMRANDYANGIVLIVDYTDVSLIDVLKKINLVELQQLTTIFIEGYGARVRGVHVITDSKAIDMFIKAVKPMIPSKIVDRIFVQRDTVGLSNIIDKEILPTEYGGSERSIEKLYHEWLDIMNVKEFQKYLAVMKSSCTDESLRTSAKFNEQIMGLPGSFRTLNVD